MDPFLYVVASAFPGRAGILSSAGKARRKAAIPSAFFLFDEKTNRHLNLRKLFPYPANIPPFVEPFL